MNNVIRRTSTLLAATGLAVSLSVAGMAPATAATVTKPDRVGDAPAHLDITSVTYRNNDRAVSARIRIPGLERRGKARLAVGPPGTDIGFEAIVRIGRDNELKKRLVFFTNTGTQRVRCDVSARWVASKNFIRISVPQSCLKLKEKRLYMVAGTGDWADNARPARALRRG